MSSFRRWTIGICAASLLVFPSLASAQYSAISTPFQGAGDSYYERMGFGFGGNIGNNVFFNNGGGNPAVPFGGGNPGGGANFGFGVRGNGFNMNFNGFADSGYSSNLSSTTPSVVVPNGGTGSIFSGQIRPFVTGLVPVVGAFSPGVGYTQLPPTYTSPLVERMVRMHDQLATAPSRSTSSNTSAESAPPARTVSTAERGDLSLSEIRAQAAAQADVESEEMAALLEAARLREAAGDYGQAIIDYGRAASRAKGALREELRIKMRELRAAK